MSCISLTAQFSSSFGGPPAVTIDRPARVINDTGTSPTRAYQSLEMAAATEAPVTNGSGSNSPTFINRVASIPVVSDTINKAQEIVNSNSYSAAAYKQADKVAQTLYRATEPVQKALGPQIGVVDTYANKGLDFIEARVPTAFAPTSEVIATARKPADDAAQFAKRNLGGVADQVSEQLKAASQSIVQIQTKLQEVVASVPRNSKDVHQTASHVQEQIKSLTDSLLAEVGKLNKSLGSAREDLPAKAQEALGPLYSSVSEGLAHIKEELSKTDVPIATRAQNVLAYTQKNTTPFINDAINQLKAIVSKNKSTALSTPPRARRTKSPSKLFGGQHAFLPFVPALDPHTPYFTSFAYDLTNRLAKTKALIVPQTSQAVRFLQESCHTIPSIIPNGRLRSRSKDLTPADRPIPPCSSLV
ncbi:hypothetical protein E5Q_05135 [Mixia osmundae IAM 14324]|uniref:Lipid droplet-associated perilipin protein n=1 Tax=Mixia osmundae (strain CBS 9802 / IAM 14324 / JCM 22182 / KY 12970) TaxID=764103 RepID=G7E6I9_MIXOS|nr:hypothetical protein E5Q_05135 [Mixia osmundae IAM 14324]